jgi:hypothetical protein
MPPLVRSVVRSPRRNHRGRSPCAAEPVDRVRELYRVATGEFGNRPALLVGGSFGAPPNGSRSSQPWTSRTPDGGRAPLCPVRRVGAAVLDAGTIDLSQCPIRLLAATAGPRHPQRCVSSLRGNANRAVRRFGSCLEEAPAQPRAVRSARPRRRADEDLVERHAPGPRDGEGDDLGDVLGLDGEVLDASSWSSRSPSTFSKLTSFLTPPAWTRPS